MLQLHIDTRKNSVSTFSKNGEQIGSKHQFARRWEALLLALLVQESKASRSLSTESLNTVLAQRGQSTALNRAQILRLLQSLQTFFDLQSAAGLNISTAPRKATVGPWLLHHEESLVFCVDGDQGAEHWPHPSITSDSIHEEQLCQVLSVLLIADALASEGKFRSAIDVLEALDHQQLSDEASGLISLRLCSWHKHVGSFERAREYAAAVTQRSAVADPGLREYAQLIMRRIDYDENPTGTWERLWQASGKPPSLDVRHAGHGSDWRTLAEWHNMRALLARRRLHAVLNNQGASAQPDQKQGPAHAMHALALRHYQAAMYMAAWFRDWDLLQAYVANLAYHLQSLMGSGAPLGTQAKAVLRWHRLTMAYEDKFSAGRDSAWEYIFFAKFWLDNHAALAQDQAIDPLAHSLGNTSPEHEAFYQRAIDRLHECGDERQVAIGRSLYLQYAQQHMRGRAQTTVLHEQAEQLHQLLTARINSTLLSNLRSEGYDLYWPADLSDRLKHQVRKRNK